MAIDCDADTDGLGYGDLAWHGSQTPGRSFAITITPRETMPAGGNRRIMGKWSDGNAFLIQCTRIGGEVFDEIGFTLHDGVSNIWGILTDDAPLTENNVFHIVCRHDGSSGVGVAAGNIWINGVERSIEQWFIGAITTDYEDAAAPVEIGEETSSVAVGMIAEYAEAALWLESIPDAAAQSISAGASPMFWPQGLLMYAPLWNAAFDDDIIGRVDPTQNGSVGSAPHPGIWYPRQNHIVHAPPSGPPLTPVHFGESNLGNMPIRRAREMVAY